MHRLFLSAHFIFICSIAISSFAQATVYIPPGLEAGDIYQIAFLTSGSRDATSSNISDYNDFVNSQAALNSSLTGSDLGIKYSAIVSTEAVDARDNALVIAPVYRFDGVLVAGGFAEFWGGNPSAPIFVDQFGVEAGVGSIFGAFAWMGTLPNGEGAGSQELGNPSGVSVAGHPPGPLAAGSHWLSAGTTLQGNLGPLFAISGPLNFEGQPVPEPSTLASSLIVLVSLMFLPYVSGRNFPQ